MNKLFLLSILLSSNAYSANTCTTAKSDTNHFVVNDVNKSVPNYLKGATITVRLANGKETSVPAERFKVVPRKQQFVVNEVDTNTVTTCTNDAPKSNRVSALAGYGTRSGLESSSTATSVDVGNVVGFVGGIQYQRMLSDRLSVGAQMQNNNTNSLLLGLDF